MLTVVVIEDDLNHLYLLTDAIGGIVYPCDNGDRVALVLAGVRPNVVVTDLRGCGDGTPREYLSRLRATVTRFSGATCPIVVVSAADPREVECAREGLDEVYAVPKPWTRDALRSTLAAVTDAVEG